MSSAVGTVTFSEAFVLLPIVQKSQSVKKLVSIFLLIAFAFSSVGLSATQHLCSMSKEEIAANKCGMCASEKQDEESGSRDEEMGTGKKTADKPADKKSCCSNESIHLKLDTDATSAKLVSDLQPLFIAALLTSVIESDVSSATVLPPTPCFSLRSFPLAEEHTVLRV